VAVDSVTDEGGKWTLETLQPRRRRAATSERRREHPAKQRVENSQTLLGFGGRNLHTQHTPRLRTRHDAGGTPAPSGRTACRQHSQSIIEPHAQRHSKRQRLEGHPVGLGARDEGRGYRGLRLALAHSRDCSRDCRGVDHIGRGWTRWRELDGLLRLRTRRLFRLGREVIRRGAGGDRRNRGMLRACRGIVDFGVRRFLAHTGPLGP
jgi:hypothetical protein